MDFLRGFAILLVILHHTEGQIASNIGSYPQLLVSLNDLAGPFRMPLLMMLSGFLLAKSLRKRPSAYVSGKLRTIAWPYMFWSTILITLLIITRNLQEGVTPLAAFVAIFYNPPTYLWYLAYLLLFYMAALLIAPLGNARSLGIFLALTAAAIVPDGNWGKMLFLFGFFLFGDALAIHWERAETILRKPLVVAAASVLVLIGAVASAVGVTVNYQPIWSANIAAIFVMMMPVAKWAMRYRLSEFVAKVGEASIVFYCTHFVFLMLFFNILERFGVSNAIILVVVLIPLTIALGWIMMYIRERRIFGIMFVWPSGHQPASQVRIPS